MLPDRARKGLVQRGLADIHPSSFIWRMSDSTIVCHEVSNILVFRDLLFFFRPVGIHEAERLCCRPRVALTEEVPKLVEVFGVDESTVYSVVRHVAPSLQCLRAREEGHRLSERSIHPSGCAWTCLCTAPLSAYKTGNAAADDQNS